MGIESIKKNHPVIIEMDQKSIVEQIIIPFSEISSQVKEEYIYIGDEKIPFKERHPVFQTLMLSEFGNY
ncbi:MAG: hypothetical protein ACFE8B_07380 [Candidatus Hermodarchaeota archaeon]